MSDAIKERAWFNVNENIKQHVVLYIENNEQAFDEWGEWIKTVKGVTIPALEMWQSHPETADELAVEWANEHDWVIDEMVKEEVEHLSCCYDEDVNRFND